MRALVLGASGQVGGALCAALAARGHHVVGTHHRVPGADTQPLDLADAAAVARLIDAVEPDCVFCAGALTHVDYCEEHVEETFRLNRDGPAAAARAAAKRGAGIVFFSTDYVFDGTAGPYAEDDLPNPLSVYGRSKLEAERLVRAENPRSVVVRTAVAYGPERQQKNFVYQLLGRLRAGEPMRVARDQRSSPTYNVDLAAATVELAERGITGVMHVAGPEVLDRYAFARLACEVFELDPRLLTPVLTAELAQRARRPLDAGLRVDRAERTLATPLSAPRAGLEAMRARLVDTPQPRL
jgi:dTDP-4-dehydrorhamnose reductase